MYRSTSAETSLCAAVGVTSVNMIPAVAASKYAGVVATLSILLNSFLVIVSLIYLQRRSLMWHLTPGITRPARNTQKDRPNVDRGLGCMRELARWNHPLNSSCDGGSLKLPGCRASSSFIFKVRHPSFRHMAIDLTRPRDFTQASRNESTYETRSRCSRPTICYTRVVGISLCLNATLPISRVRSKMVLYTHV